MEKDWVEGEGRLSNLYLTSKDSLLVEMCWGLKGITEKLDYLQDLGIDILWFLFYRSPFDQGLDISDYYAIDPYFGT